MSPSNSDENLLFAILAVQMDFIDQNKLVAGMNAWVLKKAKPLGNIPVSQRTLNEETYQLLEALVAKHLQNHDNNPEASLAGAADNSFTPARTMSMATLPL